jgi:hypothetical protein
MPSGGEAKRSGKWLEKSPKFQPILKVVLLTAIAKAFATQAAIGFSDQSHFSLDVSMKFGKWL